MKPPQINGGAGNAPTAFSASAGAAMLLLLAINLFNYIDRQILSAVVPHIKEELLANPESSGPVVGFLLKILGGLLGGNPENAMVGLLAMAFMVTYMVAAPVLGSLKFKRWWIIAGGIVVWSLASGASGLAAGFGMLLLTRCLVGLGEAAYGPVAPSILSDYYPVEARGKALSWFYLAIPVGSALGFVLGGLIAGSDLGWRWAFYLVVPPGLLLGLLCLFMKEPRTGAKPNAAPAKPPEPVKQSRFALYKSFLANRSYRLNTVAMTFMTFAIGGIGFWMPTYIHEYRQAGSLASVNIIFGGILVLAGLSATLLGGMLADRLRGKIKGSYFKVSGWAMILGFPASLGILYAPFPFAWVFVFLACFCLFLNTGPSNTALANVIAPALRPGAFALNILVIHLFGDVLSPLVIGAVTDATGSMSTAFLVVSVLILAGGITWLFASRHLDEDTALVSKHE
ncbi:MAG TPA: MFS transporter [Candidatus Obscuribacter sp.]|nr:MFS transporter [Candidatus Obscuribacter sp.]